MLDTGHVNVTARALGLDPKAYWTEHVEKLGPRLQHLHLDDNLGDLNSHLVPGDGNFDFKLCLRQPQAIGIRRMVVRRNWHFRQEPDPARAEGHPSADPRHRVPAVGRGMTTTPHGTRP